MKERLGDFSIREKNLWLELLVDIVVAIYYYPRVFNLVMQGDEALSGAATTGLIINTIILAIVTAVVLQCFLHNSAKPEAKDERDYMIDARSTLWSARLLVAFILAIMGMIVMQEFNLWGQQAPIIFSPLVIAHFMLASLMVSSVMQKAVKIFMYRRGYA